MNELISTSNRDIIVELTESKYLTRYPCSVCGGCTEKVNALAEVLSGPYEGLRVCETCLEAGDIDERLEQHAAELEGEAKAIRTLIGRLRVPSFAEWQAHERSDIADYAASRLQGTREEIDAEIEKIKHDDATYEAWRQRAEQEEREKRAASYDNGQGTFEDDFPF